MIRAMLLTVSCALVLLWECPAPAQSPEPQWWKGNLHTHTLWSDGNQFPEMAADWYRTRGYHFLALSDHNVLKQGMRWMPARQILERGGAGVIDDYVARFGRDWVEMRELPESDDYEVRLKPLDEYRYLLESAGEFILIPAEEISDRSQGKPVHMNATNLAEVISPVGGGTVREAIANNLRAVQEQAEKRGREILLHLNHPNFGWAITPQDLAYVTEEKFFEVYNGHPAVNHLGDDEHPSVEKFWDIANVLRLTLLDAEPLMGVATDDTHHYHGRGGSRPGRGWVMVRSKYLTPEHLIRAMRAGDFYCSSGVSLVDVRFDRERRTLEVVAAERAGESLRIDFVGSPRPTGERPLPREQIGVVLASVEGKRAEYKLTGSELYVRAVVTSSLDAVDPSFAGQKQQAWTQPVGWRIAPQ
jgi:hypothetical protein